MAVFTRTLDDVTARMPEVVEAALALPARTAVLDGEAIALRPDGSPLPFQVTARRIGGSSGVEALRPRIPLTAVLFDVLHADGERPDRPARRARFRRCRASVPERLIVPRELVADAAAAQAFLDDAIDHGHEGVC